MPDFKVGDEAIVNAKNGQIRYYRGQRPNHTMVCEIPNGTVVKIESIGTEVHPSGFVVARFSHPEYGTRPCALSMLKPSRIFYATKDWSEELKAEFQQPPGAFFKQEDIDRNVESRDAEGVFPDDSAAICGKANSFVFLPAEGVWMQSQQETSDRIKLMKYLRMHGDHLVSDSSLKEVLMGSSDPIPKMSRVTLDCTLPSEPSFKPGDKVRVKDCPPGSRTWPCIPSVQGDELVAEVGQVFEVYQDNGGEFVSLKWDRSSIGHVSIDRADIELVTGVTHLCHCPTSQLLHGEGCTCGGK